MHRCRYTFRFLFATGLAGMISEDLDQQGVRTLLVQVDDRIVQRILVLLQPAGDVVSNLLQTNRSINVDNIHYIFCTLISGIKLP